MATSAISSNTNASEARALADDVTRSPANSGLSDSLSVDEAVTASRLASSHDSAESSRSVLVPTRLQTASIQARLKWMRLKATSAAHSQPKISR